MQEYYTFKSNTITVISEVLNHQIFWIFFIFLICLLWSHQ